MHWIFYFFMALSISLILSMAVIAIKKKSKEVYCNRLGGLAVIMAFLLTFWLDDRVIVTSQIAALIIGTLAIVVVGLWDDIKKLSWKPQLAAQALLAVLIVGMGYNIDVISNPLGGIIRLDMWQFEIGAVVISFFSALLIFGWMIGVMNAINWADGIDGLAGGIGILGSLAIFLVSLRAEVNQPAVAIISLIIIGSLLGFWWFNFPVGKIEAGTSGSYFIGFMLAALAIIAGTKIATAMIILALPIIDALWVIWERQMEGQSIVSKDIKQRHLHYRLRNIGWSDQRILLVYLGFLALMLIISLYIPGRAYKFVLLGIEVFCAIGLIHYAQRKEKLIIINHKHDTKTASLKR